MKKSICPSVMRSERNSQENYSVEGPQDYTDYPAIQI
jgi:hypothetical protein